jgi:histidinol-phosphate aminotransferase
MPSAESHFLDLAAPGVRGLTPYQPGKPVAELERELGIRNAIKLASNENPYGPSPHALAAAQAALQHIARYPEGSGYQLVERLAALHGVAPGCITLGNGSNDVLDMVARVFLTPQHEAVFSQYAFAVYPISVQAVGAVARVAPAHDGSRGPAYGHDLHAMAAQVGAQTRVVFIANPNNPTGTWLPAAELEGFVAQLPAHVMVVIDEAYFEYVADAHYPDSSRWLERYPNLIVTRTFSKAYGLAGLRVGYALSHPQVAGLLNRVRQPFNVNLVAQAAALAALDDRQHLAECVRHNQAGMQQLVAGFDRLHLSYVESAGNFVAVDVGRPGPEVYQALLKEGVIVRPVANYGMPQHLRITIGKPEENERFLQSLQRVLA